MAEFEHGQVQFKRGVATLLRQHVRHQVLHQLTAAVKQLPLHFLIVLLLGNLHNHPRQFLQFGVSLHNGDGGLHRTRTLQNGR